VSGGHWGAMVAAAATLATRVWERVQLVTC
jgi:hypothetical protein